MKRNLKAILALLLAAVIVLALPLSAAATTVSGTHNGYNYTGISNGSYTSIYGKLSYATSARLEVSTLPDVFYLKPNNTWGHLSNPPSEFEYNPSCTSVTLSYTYLDYKNANPSLSIDTGYFYGCYYTYKIGTSVVDGWGMNF